MEQRASIWNFARILASLVFCAGPAAASEPLRGVVELFTSQACSSCPPADRLMNEMSGDKSLVTLSYAVDYWDYTGWKDTLAIPACANRQKAYAAARGDGHVYTPQAVVGGIGHVAGADRAAIEKAVVDNAPSSLRSGVRVSLGERDGALSVVVEGPDKVEPARVLVISVAREKTVVIGRGENRGAKMTYSNVVRALADVGAYAGGKQSFSAARGDGDFHVVLVQRGEKAKPGAILAAARL